MRDGPLSRTYRVSDLASVPLDQIPYVDHPEIKIDEHESTQMPFRYVADAEGQPILPEVSSRRKQAMRDRD